jgi:glutathione synthase/RimK-type ligase-like ATP-grasp enzyme
MQTILIPSKPDDADSLFVSHALRHFGHHPVIWYPSDLPIQQYSTFKLSTDADTEWSIRGEHGETMPSHIDTVWLRRPRSAILPNYIHPDDLSAVKIENKRFFDLIWYSIAPNAFWVNPIAAIKKSNSKLGQLEIARKLGFKIPPTILSNDPVEIKSFINSHSDVIYKPLRSHYWDEGDVLRISYTNVVTCDQLPDDQVLKLTPGIYQSKIKKAYELRVTYFGTYAVPVLLHSQTHQCGELDWRSIPEGKMEIELTKLPPEIHEKCIALMQHYDLKMGCFDFIVTPEGDYYYLEVNEQGQFLWIEEYNKNIPILDVFTKFLIHNRMDFNYDSKTPAVTLDGLRTSVFEELNHNQSLHQSTGIF